MKLSYSLAGKLWWIENFLDHNTYKGIHDAIIKERKKINLHSSKGIWPDGLINNLIPPLRNQVSNYPPFEKLKTLVTLNPYFQLEKPDNKHTNIHYMKKGSGINWHVDDTWRYAATYYINHSWNEHWGGEFMFSDSGSHGFIPIVGNSVIIVKTPLKHKVNTVLSPTMPRISVQIFMK